MLADVDAEPLNRASGFGIKVELWIRGAGDQDGEDEELQLAAVERGDEHHVVPVLEPVFQLPLRVRPHKHSDPHCCRRLLPPGLLPPGLLPPGLLASCLLASCLLAAAQSMTDFSFHLHPRRRPQIQSMDPK